MCPLGVELFHAGGQMGKYFGNISESVTFLHLIDALFYLEFIVCIL
jgi:hypothetical protein